MVGLKVISQEAWDEVVASYVEDFDLEEDEAISSALEELKLKGVDLSGIQERGVKDRSKQPVIRLLEGLQAVLSPSSRTASEVEAALQAFTDAVTSQREDMAHPAHIAVQHGAVAIVISAMQKCSAGESMQLLGLRALRLLLQDEQSRAHFASEGGAAVVLHILKDHAGCSEELTQAAAEVVEAAATKSEDNKSAFVAGGVGTCFREALLQASAGVGLIRAVAGAVKRLTTADDKRPVVSRAFQNGRGLSQAGLHMAFLAVLKRSRPPCAEVAAACCSAVKKLAVNDDLCLEISDGGCVPLVLMVLRDQLHHAQCTATACALLRQLAGNDSIKAQIVEGGGWDVLVSAINMQSSSACAMEHALGLVAAITLRNPAAAKTAVEAGVADSIMQVMEGLQQQWVQRQACMALRNLVARAPDLRATLLEKGAESALRRARQEFPAACQDVGTAALRDLGLDNYNL